MSIPGPSERPGAGVPPVPRRRPKTRLSHPTAPSVNPPWWPVCANDKMIGMPDSATDRTYDIAILGGGSGGYSGALRAAQLGLSVALVEKDQLGGPCLHRGCLAAKAL